MIVKDEAAVIERCLRSAVPHITYAVIYDTGSTDNTMRLIADLLTEHDIPFEIYERPWVNFAHNRNEALETARKRADWVLFIDADEQFTAADESLDTDSLLNVDLSGHDAYMLKCVYGGWEYWRNALVSSRLPFRWEGVIHEYVTCDQPHKWGNLETGPCIFVKHDGARGKNPDTYKRDIEVLEKAVKDEPGNARYAFYLAQSYRDAGMPEQARHWYHARACMGGFAEEAWFAEFQAALLVTPGDKENYLLDVWRKRPWRAEPLIEMCKLLREEKRFDEVVVWAKLAAAMPVSTDRLFIDVGAYTWKAWDELVVAAWYSKLPFANYIGRMYADMLRENMAVVPLGEQPRIRDNIGMYERL